MNRKFYEQLRKFYELDKILKKSAEYFLNLSKRIIDTLGKILEKFQKCGRFFGIIKNILKKFRRDFGKYLRKGEWLEKIKNFGRYFLKISAMF